VPFPEGVDMHVHNDLSRAGLKIGSPKLNLNWTIRPDKVVIESDSPIDNCGEIMERLFEELPWTPLQAQGNNFQFEAPLDELAQIRRQLDFPPAEGHRDYGLVRRGWHLALKISEEKTCVLQLSVTPTGIQAATNFHTDLENRSNDCAREAARSFFDDRREAVRLFEESFGVHIENGHVHV
jgi:hypothetical protein